MRRFVLILAVLTLLVVAVAPAALAASPIKKAGKVGIVHIPPGNPDGAHCIAISRSALPAHLAHGDVQRCKLP